MDLNVLGYSEHDFTIFKNIYVCLYVSRYVCDRNSVAALAEEFIDGIAWNFIFSCILT